MDSDEVKVRVVELEIEHRDLDTAIELLNESLTVDALQLQRLKKRKLQLKDQIIQLKMQLIPDIPA
jgi:hypothetical protein